MGNRNPEQDIIDLFTDALQNHTDNDIKIKTLVNKNCRARKHADIEFISTSGCYWVIEAKSNDSSDAHNTVHKIFGELLKETGRENRSDCKYGILIPECGKEFYSRLFQAINRDKFIEFGKLIPVDSVFTYGQLGVQTMSWEKLYDLYKP